MLRRSLKWKQSNKKNNVTFCSFHFCFHWMWPSIWDDIKMFKSNSQSFKSCQSYNNSALWANDWFSILNSILTIFFFCNMFIKEDHIATFVKHNFTRLQNNYYPSISVVKSSSPTVDCCSEDKKGNKEEWWRNVNSQQWWHYISLHYDYIVTLLRSTQIQSPLHSLPHNFTSLSVVSKRIVPIIQMVVRLTTHHQLLNSSSGSDDVR